MEKAKISRKGDEQLDGKEGWDFHKYYDPKARNISLWFVRFFLFAQINLWSVIQKKKGGG